MGLGLGRSEFDGLGVVGKFSSVDGSDDHMYSRSHPQPP